jgi:hypothetical protein
MLVFDVKVKGWEAKVNFRALANIDLFGLEKLGNFSFLVINFRRFRKGASNRRFHFFLNNNKNYNKEKISRI